MPTNPIDQFISNYPPEIQTNPRRQGIVDSWPEDVDDSRARNDWNWKPDYDVDRFFEEYFLPEIRKRYGK